MMFVNCSPADRAAPETLCSLQFARRVRMVKLSATAALENATLLRYKSQLDDSAEAKRGAEEKLHRTVERWEAKVREKDELIAELNERVKSSSSKMAQAEVARKREIAELVAQQSKASKQGDSKAERERMMRKVSQLEEKAETVTNLLKLSQRENQKLKEAEAARAAELHSSEAASGKTRALEARLEELARKARNETNARKRAEEAGEVRTTRRALFFLSALLSLSLSLPLSLSFSLSCSPLSPFLSPLFAVLYW